EDTVVAVGDVAKARAEGYGFTNRAAPGSGGEPGRVTEEHDLEALSPAEKAAYHDALLGTDTEAEMTSGQSNGSHVVIVLPEGQGSVGVDTASCVSKARTQVYGDDIAYQKLNYGIEGLSNDVVVKARTDAAVTDAVRRWRECMRG